MNIDTLCPSVRVAMKKAAEANAYHETLVPHMRCADRVHHAITEIRAKSSAVVAKLMLSIPEDIRYEAAGWIADESDRILDQQQLRALRF